VNKNERNEIKALKVHKNRYLLFRINTQQIQFLLLSSKLSERIYSNRFVIVEYKRKREQKMF